MIITSPKKLTALARFFFPIISGPTSTVLPSKDSEAVPYPSCAPRLPPVFPRKKCTYGKPDQRDPLKHYPLRHVEPKKKGSFQEKKRKLKVHPATIPLKRKRLVDQVRQQIAAAPKSGDDAIFLAHFSKLMEQTNNFEQIQRLEAHTKFLEERRADASRALTELAHVKSTPPKLRDGETGASTGKGPQFCRPPHLHKENLHKQITPSPAHKQNQQPPQLNEKQSPALNSPRKTGQTPITKATQRAGRVGLSSGARQQHAPRCEPDVTSGRKAPTQKTPGHALDLLVKPKEEDQFLEREKAMARAERQRLTKETEGRQQELRNGADQVECQRLAKQVVTLEAENQHLRAEHERLATLQENNENLQRVKFEELQTLTDQLATLQAEQATLERNKLEEGQWFEQQLAVLQAENEAKFTELRNLAGQLEALQAEHQRLQESQVAERQHFQEAVMRHAENEFNMHATAIQKAAEEAQNLRLAELQQCQRRLEEVVHMLEYDRKWNIIKSSSPTKHANTYRFSEFPWPIFGNVTCVKDITADAVHQFFSTRGTGGLSPKEALHAEILKWHPDKLNTRLGTVVSTDREAVKEGGEWISKLLNSYHA